MNERFKLTKRDFERLGFTYIGRSHLYGEHYNYYPNGKHSHDPAYMLNYNRKAGTVTMTKCLDERTVDGLLSKIRLEERRKGLIDYIGYAVAFGIIALCALGVLKAAGINILG